MPSDDPLAALCVLALANTRAAAVSIAAVESAGLHYVAAAGAGGAEIVGTRMAAGEGIAGFVAATGQSLSVRDVAVEPRFARDVGERTGYVPTSIHCLPVVDHHGEVIAVVSLLDAGPDADDVASPLTALTDLASVLLAARTTLDDRVSRAAERMQRLPSSDAARALDVVETLLDAMER